MENGTETGSGTLENLIVATRRAATWMIGRALLFGLSAKGPSLTPQSLAAWS